MSWELFADNFFLFLITGIFGIATKILWSLGKDVSELNKRVAVIIAEVAHQKETQTIILKKIDRHEEEIMKLKVTE